MTSVYLTDFDLEGDVCECGEPVKGHPPLARPSSVTEGRGAQSEADVAFRRYPVFVGPPGEGIQVTRPADPSRGHNKSRWTDEQLIAAIEANPQGTYAQIAAVVGVSAAPVHLRLERMAREGRLPASAEVWRAKRSKSRGQRGHRA